MAEPPGPASTPGDVVLALEPRGAVDGASLLRSLRSLVDLAMGAGGPVLLRLDPVTVRSSAAILDLVGSRQASVLPCIVAGEAAGVGLQLECLRRLDEAGAIAERNGCSYAGVVADSGDPIEAIASEVATVIERPGRALRLGHLNFRSPYLAIPRWASFTFDWPPYRAARGLIGEPVLQNYSEVALQLARRHAGLGPVVPSVIGTTAPSIDVEGAGVRVTSASAIKIAYAIDAARRFVHNRAGNGPGFWVFRVDLGDNEGGGGLAALLGRPHRSVAPGHEPDRVRLPAGGARIAAVVHLFYPEVWPDLAGAIAAIPEPCDVFVSCPWRARAAVERMVRERFPDALVFGTQNRGRDVLPFLQWLALPGIERYRYVLKLHSKKSTHLVDGSDARLQSGDDWRRRSLGGLTGGPQRTARLLQALDAAPDVGLVAPPGLLFDQATWECAIGDVIATLRDRLGIPGPLEGSFPAGTMFWARIDALALLRQPPVGLMDFEPEAGQVDGTLHHAYERLFPFAATARGYRTVAADQLGAPELQSMEGSALPL